MNRLSHPVVMGNQSPSTPTMDEHDAAMDEVVVATLPPPSGISVPHVKRVSVDPDHPAVCGSLDQRLEHLEEDWMTKEVTVSMERLDADQPPLRDFYSSSASERALAVNMVASVVWGVMNASLGESLHVLKWNGRQEHPEFGFIAELVTQAAVETRREENTRQHGSLVRRGSMKEVAVQTGRKTGEWKLPHNLTEAFGRYWLELNTRRVPEKKRQCRFPGMPRRVRKAPLLASTTVGTAERDSTKQPMALSVLSRQLRCRSGQSWIVNWTPSWRILVSFFRRCLTKSNPSHQLMSCPLNRDGAEGDGTGEPRDEQSPGRDEDRLGLAELGSTNCAD